MRTHQVTSSSFQTASMTWPGSSQHRNQHGSDPCMRGRIHVDAVPFAQLHDLRSVEKIATESKGESTWSFGSIATFRSAPSDSSLYSSMMPIAVVRSAAYKALRLMDGVARARHLHQPCLECAICSDERSNIFSESLVPSIKMRTPSGRPGLQTCSEEHPAIRERTGRIVAVMVLPFNPSSITNASSPSLACSTPDQRTDRG